LAGQTGTRKRTIRQKPSKVEHSENGDAQIGALGAQTGPCDADLAMLVEAWPSLPAAIKAGILAMVRAAAG
jgi:hypothetical protein